MALPQGSRPPSTPFCSLTATTSGASWKASAGEVVGKALSKFTEEVQQVVTKHQGVTIYAGGDDVLAMLPVEDALSCANALAECYRRSFGDKHPQATLSATVLFAQMRVPLRTVLAEARRLLNEEAKDGNGRNSLAAAVYKPRCPPLPMDNDIGRTMAPRSRTPYARWQPTWPNQTAHTPVCRLRCLYRVRETLALFGDQPQWKPGTWFQLPSNIDIRALLRSEIFHSLSVRTGAGADRLTDELVDSVRPLMRPARNGQVNGVANIPESTEQAGMDALLLARFLSRRGHEDKGQ